MATDEEIFKEFMVYKKAFQMRQVSASPTSSSSLAKSQQVSSTPSSSSPSSASSSANKAKPSNNNNTPIANKTRLKRLAVSNQTTNLKAIASCFSKDKSQTQSTVARLSSAKVQRDEYALVVWTIDNKISILHVSKFPNAATQSLTEGTVHNLKHNNAMYEATILAFGTKDDCEKVAEYSKAPKTKQVKSIQKQAAIATNTDQIEQNVIDDENTTLKSKIKELSTSLSSREMEIVKLKQETAEKLSTIDKFAKAFRKNL